MGIILENYCKITRNLGMKYVLLRFWVKDMQKLFDDYFVLCECYLLCGIMGTILG